MASKPQAADFDLEEAGSKVKEFDKGSQRLLDLLFTLNASPHPLTTEEIISNADIGYGSPNRASDAKKFKRDRERLAKHGVMITCVDEDGKPQTDQSSWEIDRASTHAASGEITLDDAELILSAIEETFDLHADDPLEWPLQRACVKLREATGILPSESPDDLAGAPERRALMRAIWSAFDRRARLAIVYRDSKGSQRERVIETYGLFSMGSHNYIVGNDIAINEVRTFRTDRIVSASAAPASQAPYDIPESFDIRDYHFLPFDFSAARPVDATFAFSKGMGRQEIDLITKGRGHLERHDHGNWTWTVDVRDLDAAASWVIELAGRGVRAEAPAELVHRIHSRILKAVEANA